MIISHEHPEYIKRWKQAGINKYNGAYYYSKEIVKNIIPKVDTSRNWLTIRIPEIVLDHSIVFIHNNKIPGLYNYLRPCKDLVLVCGITETCEKMKYLGKAIYLPLSIDVAGVEKYKTKKTKQAAFVGRPAKRSGLKLPDGIDILEGLPREELLTEMAKYKEVYAVGRCAVEARALGCKLRPYDPRFKHTNRWRVLDNSEAAEILQKKLERIDDN